MGLTGGSSGEKLRKQIAKHMGHGEFLVASARLLHRAAADAANAPPEGRPLPGKLVLAVTDRRVLVLRLGGVRDHVREVTHSIPLRSITDVRSDADTKTVHLALTFGDGATVALEAVRPNIMDGEEVAHALTTALARR